MQARAFVPFFISVNSYVTKSVTPEEVCTFNCILILQNIGFGGLEHRANWINETVCIILLINK